MKLPHLPDPHYYVGLYAFDFGDWVAIGYTAEEVTVLLASPEYRGGQALRVYRVGADGSVELAGVSAADLGGEEMMLFARANAEQAREDFRQLQAAAGSRRPPLSVTMELVDIDELQPPHVVALIYPRHGALVVSAWLNALNFHGGDLVMGGAEVLDLYRRSAPQPTARCHLPGVAGLTARSPEEVLGSVHEPLQRRPRAPGDRE